MRIIVDANSIDVYSPSAISSPTRNKMARLQRIDIVEEHVTEGGAAAVIDNAESLITRHLFGEAEELLLVAYRRIQDKPESNSMSLIRTLQGLADISRNRSKIHRHHAMESLWMTVHGAALLREVVELCDVELRNCLDTNCDFYTRTMYRSQRLIGQLEGALEKSLYNQLRKQDNCRLLLQALTPVNLSSPDTRSYFPLSSNMPQHQSLPYYKRSTFDTLNMFKEKDVSVKADLTDATDFIMKFQSYWKARLFNNNIGECMNTLLGAEGASGRLDAKDYQKPQAPFPNINDVIEFEKGMYRSSTPNSRRGDNTSDSGTEDDVFYSNECDVTIGVTDAYHQEDAALTPADDKIVSLIIAKALNSTADKLMENEELRKAEALFDHILEIFEEIQNGTVGMLRLNAQILTKAGMLKSRLDKFDVGIVLVEKALYIFKDIRDEKSNVDVAKAMLELGNSHMAKKWQDNALLDVVINVVCDSFEKDVTDLPVESPVFKNPDQECGDSGIAEVGMEPDVRMAKQCYMETVAILEEDIVNDELLARATLKLGDCYLLEKEFNLALACYEKSLLLFKSLPSNLTFSLHEHSHLLCMLGVATLRLYLYPRAASVFEIACHLTRRKESNTFSYGLFLSLLGITQYKLQNHYKCVSFCFQAWELFSKLYGSTMAHLSKEKFWLTCQVLYVMGNSYKHLNMLNKAVKYLGTARSMLRDVSPEIVDRKQVMRVLQVLGDCYFAQYDYKTSLSYYNEALQFCERSGLSVHANHNPAEMGLHNQLLSRSADANISMNQYENVMDYLTEARTIQETKEGDIKEDLVSTLKKIAMMHSMSGDVDRAIDALKESLEIYSEMYSELGPDMCETLGNLGTMCHVKACLCEEIDQELEMNLAAEKYFQEALNLDMKSSVCVKYANFLYSQSNYDDAIFYLEDLLKSRKFDEYITFSGLEKVTLPGTLQDEVEFEEEIVIPLESLARYLLILCFCTVGLSVCAEEEMFRLMKDTYNYNTPLLHSLLAYSMMELHLFKEAAESFAMSAGLNQDNPLTVSNFWTCVVLYHFFNIQKALENMWIKFKWFNDDYL